MTQYWIVTDQPLPDHIIDPQTLPNGLSWGIVPETWDSHAWLHEGARSGAGFYARLRHGWRPEALFFDMDATFVEEETLVEIASRCGMGEQVRVITDRAMAGELDFAASLRERVATLHGHPVEHLYAVQQAMRLTKGLDFLLESARKWDLPCFLVSGGFNQLAGPLASEMGLMAYAANELGIEDGRFTGKVEGRVVDAEFKRRWLMEMAERHGLDLDQCVAIGDGANDKPMLQAAGLAVGFRPRPALYDVLDVCNHTGDHGLMAVVLDHCHK